MTLATVEILGNRGPKYVGGDKEFWKEQKPSEKIPAFIGKYEFLDVPEHISNAGGEAFKCVDAGFYRAAIILARSVIESVAKESGVSSGKLLVKIDEMRKEGLISEHLKTAAHAIRVFGNDMAHGDFSKTVSVDDASDCVEFMKKIIEEVIQGPAQARDLAERAASRKVEE